MLGLDWGQEERGADKKETDGWMASQPLMDFSSHGELRELVMDRGGHMMLSRLISQHKRVRNYD